MIQGKLLIKYFLIFLVVCVIVLYVYQNYRTVSVAYHTNPNMNIIDRYTLTTDTNKTISLIPVITDEQHTWGLSLFPSLDRDQGMIFVFTQPQQLGFWMRDMLFPLDMIWLDATMRIVDIHTNISPNTYPEIFSPSVPAQYVIELPAGAAKNHGFFKGQQIHIAK